MQDAIMKRDQNMVLVRSVNIMMMWDVGALVDVSPHITPDQLELSSCNTLRRRHFHIKYILATGKYNESVCEKDQFVFAL